ncbi:Uncharacterised protein [uncultured archaeon]|nr:Uncharacterised protein [uncultured archaeon]
MAKEVPWDAQTDAFILDLNSKISKKYDVDFTAMLLNPDSYVGKKDIAGTLTKVRADVDVYFSDLLDGMKDEQAELNTALATATEQYKKVNALISGKSSALRVPYVKPLFVNRNSDNEETIVVEQYNSGLDSLIGKLVTSSTYVADVSAPYKSYFLGSWLFSGNRNYILTVNPPLSPILAVENSAAIINGRLDRIAPR